MLLSPVLRLVVVDTSIHLYYLLLFDFIIALALKTVSILKLGN